MVNTKEILLLLFHHVGTLLLLIEIIAEQPVYQKYSFDRCERRSCKFAIRDTVSVFKDKKKLNQVSVIFIFKTIVNCQLPNLGLQSESSQIHQNEV